MKKNWIFFGIGVIVGIVLTFAVALVIAARSNSGSSMPSGVTLFEQPGEFLPDRSLQVLQAVEDHAALVKAKNDPYDDDEYYWGALYLLVNDEGRYYSDEEVIRVPQGKAFRKIGIYKYMSQGAGAKTVSVIQIVDR